VNIKKTKKENNIVHMPCTKHLITALVCAYAAALVFAVHLALSTLGPTELATPPLCMHTPFAGVARAFMLGPPVHASRFAACALNATVEVLPVPAANLSALSLANLYHITAPKHPLFRDIELSSLEQAGQFAAWLAALRALRYNQRALVLEASAVLAPDPRWVVLHATLAGLRGRFDVVRLEPCGGEVTRVLLERGLVLQRCVHRCFNPWVAASAVVSYAGARKMLRHADRDRQVGGVFFPFDFSPCVVTTTTRSQAYDVGWFQGLVHLAEPATFALYCVEGLGAHDDEGGGWKKKAPL
jgi:hypothetical protein